MIKKKSVKILGVVLLAMSLSACSDKSTEAITSGPELKSEVVSRGEISRIINATGAVRPEITVDVGTEVSGKILSVEVDFNSKVTKGDVLAVIDPENLENRVAQNKAQVENRTADIRIQQASLERARVNLDQARRSLDRRQQLYEENAISQAQLEETERTMKLAEADLELAQARLAGAQSALKQAQANLRVAQVDLSRTVVRAPISGVVVERLVDPGQTVAASFSAPELFRISKDLSKIKVDAAIVEGDVSGLDAGDKATFSLDAYPGRIFEGRVQQLRLKSKNQSNIVTYTAVIEAENESYALMPGMTANLQITTNFRQDILRVPTSVERFRPTPDQITQWKADSAETEKQADADPRARQRLAEIGVSQQRIDSILDRMQNETKALREKIADPTQTWRRVANMKSMRAILDDIIKDELNSTEYQKYRQQKQADARIRDVEIWVKVDEKMRRKTVGLGLSDGSFTEVISGLEEGEIVISGIASAQPAKPGVKVRK